MAVDINFLFRIRMSHQTIFLPSLDASVTLAMMVPRAVFVFADTRRGKREWSGAEWMGGLVLQILLYWLNKLIKYNTSRQKWVVEKSTAGGATHYFQNKFRGVTIVCLK